MSRLIVKCLPANCTEKSLRTFFKKYGTLTDCTLKYTKEGKFRKFAFVGFDSDELAKKAIEETNQTFMGSARLQVEECMPFGDANKPRAWSQYAKDSSAYKRKNKDQTEVEESGSSSKKQKLDSEENPEFNSFLETQGIGAIKINDAKAPVERSEEEKKLLEELMKDITGDTSLSLLFTGLPPTIKSKSLKEWLSPVRVKALKIVPGEQSSVAFVSFNRPPDLRRALQRDSEFLGGYKLGISKIANEEAKEEEMEKTDEQIMENMVDRDTEEAKVREEILDTGRLFIRNLSFNTKEDDLRVLFKKFGEISDVQVIIDKKTGKCKGFAIVEFVFPENAVAAYSFHDGTVFKGRMMHILPGAEKRETPAETEEKATKDAGSSFKKEKMAKIKANAGKSHSWNALFLGPNAIADSLAEKLGVEKSDLLLGQSSESAGVRMALAETRLVREVRDFLIAQGVKLDSFSRPSSKRSKTVILAKNLPNGVTEDELRRLFERHGDVTKILIPPEASVSALIVMGNEVDAKKAFNALAYSRFRTQPLYLEWAPMDVFGKTDKSEEKAEEAENEEDSEEVPEVKKKSKKEMTYEEKMEEKKKKKAKKEGKKEKVVEKQEEEEPSTVEQPEEEETKQEQVKEEDEKEEEDEGIVPGSTVFVKNLAFDTTDETLHALFSSKFRIKSAKISKKLNPADPSKSLSMGFGFVQFHTSEGAEHCVKTMQGELLDGHSLELKISHREVVDKNALKRKEISAKEQGKCTKLLVRNLPFQAQIKEIESLFATFGEIRSIRIPRKVGSKDQHRGFGFVDFLSVGEAKRAFEALVHSTHLYGRRLVLEWAKEDDSVDELREKTAEKFNGDKKQRKKQKQQMMEIEKDLAGIEEDD